jgi:alcohol dehydrogenase class IV
MRAVPTVLSKRGLDTEIWSLGDIVEAYMRELDLQGSSKELGLDREQFDKIADNSMKDGSIQINPVPRVGLKMILMMAAW